jgi:hypothetical protein
MGNCLSSIKNDASYEATKRKDSKPKEKKIQQVFIRINSSLFTAELTAQIQRKILTKSLFFYIIATL